MADYSNFIIDFGCYLWIYKIQILGSIFLSLTIFEYLYKIYLKPIRKKQLHELRKIFIELDKIVIEMGNLNENELQHELLGLKIEKLAHEIESNNKVMSLEIKTNQRVLLTKFDAEFEVFNFRLDKVSETIVNVSEIATTGIKRIKKLEDDTDFIRAIKQYRYYVGASLAAFIAVTNIEQIKAWVVKMLPWH